MPGDLPDRSVVQIYMNRYTAYVRYGLLQTISARTYLNDPKSGSKTCICSFLTSRKL